MQAYRELTENSTSRPGSRTGMLRSTSRSTRLKIAVLAVGPHYFRALGRPVLEGRGFDERDNTAQGGGGEGDVRPLLLQGAITHWQVIALGGGKRDYAWIAGVVKDLKYRDLQLNFPKTVYCAAMQDASANGQAESFFVRAVSTWHAPS